MTFTWQRILNCFVFNPVKVNIKLGKISIPLKIGIYVNVKVTLAPMLNQTQDVRILRISMMVKKNECITVEE